MILNPTISSFPLMQMLQWTTAHWTLIAMLVACCIFDDVVLNYGGEASWKPASSFGLSGDSHRALTMYGIGAGVVVASLSSKCHDR